ADQLHPGVAADNPLPGDAFRVGVHPDVHLVGAQATPAVQAGVIATGGVTDDADDLPQLVGVATGRDSRSDRSTASSPSTEASALADTVVEGDARPVAGVGCPA